MDDKSRIHKPEIFCFLGQILKHAVHLVLPVRVSKVVSR